MNPLTSKYYTERDFQIGETIQLTVYKFQLLRADEFTHKYMKSKPEIFKEADITHIIERLKKLATKYKSLDEFLVDLIRKLDVNGNGVIDFQELTLGLRDLGFNLSYQEIYTLMRYFDKDENFKLDLKELYVGLGGKQ